MFILFIKRNEQPNCDFAILRFCDYFIYHPFNISSFPTSLKNFRHSLCHFANISESSGTGTSTRKSGSMYLPPWSQTQYSPLRSCLFVKFTQL